MKVDFWFDFSCPYAYLASREIEAVCARADVALALCPMLLGGVFRATGAGEGPMATLTPPRALNNARDMQRWAERRGAVLRMPAAHPMRTVRALRTLLGLPEARWSAAMHALYAAYWQDGADVTDPAVIAAALSGAGLSGGEIASAAAGADSDAIKDELRRRTDQAVAHGIFGAPAMVVHRDEQPPLLLWGQDRMHWLEAVLHGWDPDQPDSRLDRTWVADPAALAPPIPDPPALDFWFDYSSPWAYLGAQRIAEVAAAAGASLRWRPMLLGALFREVGAPDVPLFAMPEAKRRYVAGELGRWANASGVEFRFPARFPLRTVNALRLTLLADSAPALIQRIFRAAWVEDRDLGDEAVLRALCEDAGIDPGLVARTAEPAAKQALVAETAAAKAAGVFGAPTTIVHQAAGPVLFWGQDRLDLVAAALRGWHPEAG